MDGRTMLNPVTVESRQAPRWARRSKGKREERRWRFENNLKRILKLDREGHSPKAISDSLRLSTIYVSGIIDGFHRFRQARRADEGGGGVR
jgi:hypothetical protein